MNAAILILPNFVLILVGLALARRFDYGRDFWSGLEKLVYYVLFPALLFRSLAVARIDFAQAGWLAGAACAFTVAGLAP
jgi:predicted permease